MAVHCALFWAVADTAAALLAVGAAELLAATVTCVDLAAEVVMPDAISIALIIAVAALTALVGTVTTPVASTVATAVLDD